MKRFLILLSILFCTTVFAHTIEWYVDGTLLSTTTCESGDNITPPTAPTKFGYTFKNWLLYTPIEYLESTGTQYIDTGFYPNQDTSIKTKIKLLTEYVAFFGAGVSYTSNNFECYTNSNTFEFNYNGYVLLPALKTNDEVEIDWQKNHISYTINNILQPNVNFSYTTFQPPYIMTLFAYNRPNGAFTQNGRIKIYYFQIYDNDVLVRDFIPVIDATGTPCMYDKVENKFYYNAGTGDFIAGPVIFNY